MQVLNEGGHLKYCITDGINIKVFISKNLFQRFINQLLTMKIEHSKNNIVKFLGGSVRHYNSACFSEDHHRNVIAIPDSLCVREIETVLNLLYTKYGIKFDPMKCDISNLSKETQWQLLLLLKINCLNIHLLNHFSKNINAEMMMIVKMKNRSVELQKLDLKDWILNKIYGKKSVIQNFK